MNIIIKNIKDIIPYKDNPRNNNKAVEFVVNSIREFGIKQPIVIDSNNEIIAGHTRYLACKKLKINEVPCILADDLTESQVKAYRIADNSTGAVSEWDIDLLNTQIDDLPGFDFKDFGLDLDLDVEEQEIVEDEAPDVDEVENICKAGDIWQLGKHRLMCGNSTNASDVELLMNGKKADMVFTDPPYGMKKEKQGIINDNLNFDDLLEFNKLWIPLSFEVMKDVGSFYCWGIDEPLMDIYSNIIKPMIKKQQATFRNIITWNKGSPQGQNSEEYRMYPIADEKCLFVMKGVQGFNNNSDNYFEAWEPIRLYLLNSRLEMGWDIPEMKNIVGHSVLSRDHWTSKSQWSLIPEYCYELLKSKVIEEEKKTKKQYSAFKKEYEEIKKEYYSTRAYFNNTHEKMNNVWNFDRTDNKERELTGNHASPKPIALCTRAIKSSSREDEIVLDLFGGSGSTLIACEQTNRICYTMELDEKYCDVIIARYEKLTGDKAIKV